MTKQRIVIRRLMTRQLLLCGICVGILGKANTQPEVPRYEKEQAAREALLEKATARLNQVPQDPDARFEFARALELLERSDEAQGAWSQFLKLEPSSQRAVMVQYGLVPCYAQVVAEGSGGYPRPSPDGRQLLFGWDGVQIKRLDDDTPPKSVTIDKLSKLCASDWSEDGRLLGVHGVNEANQCVSIILERLENGWIHPIAQCGGMYPRFSTDGKQLLLSGEPGYSICVCNWPELTNGWYVDWVPVEGRSERNHAAWFPDGKRFVFQTWRQNSADRALYISDVPAKELPGRGLHPLQSQQAPIKVTSNSSTNETPVVSPDGSLIAYDVFDGGKRTIWISSCDGHFAVPLSVGNNPAWSPNGRVLYYGRQGAIYEARLGGLDIRPLRVDLKEAKTAQKPPLIVLSIKNREVKAQWTRVYYAVYDANSFLVASGNAGERSTRCDPGRTVEVSFPLPDMNTFVGRTLKTVCVTDDGRRVVELFDFPTQ